MSAPAFVLLSEEQLTELIRTAVSDGRAGVKPENNGPALLDRNGLAVSLGCSAALVDKLRREGMPFIRLGGSPRFELDACLSWLRGRS